MYCAVVSNFLLQTEHSRYDIGNIIYEILISIIKVHPRESNKRGNKIQGKRPRTRFYFFGVCSVRSIYSDSESQSYSSMYLRLQPRYTLWTAVLDIDAILLAQLPILATRISFTRTRIPV